MKHDTLFLGRKGWIPDERLEPGDIVVGPDGEPHKVAQIGPPGLKSAPDCFGVAFMESGDDWAIELKHGQRCHVYLSPSHLAEHSSTANRLRDEKGIARPR